MSEFGEIGVHGLSDSLKFTSQFQCMSWLSFCLQCDKFLGEIGKLVETSLDTFDRIVFFRTWGIQLNSSSLFVMLGVVQISGKTRVVPCQISSSAKTRRQSSSNVGKEELGNEVADVQHNEPLEKPEEHHQRILGQKGGNRSDEHKGVLPRGSATRHRLGRSTRPSSPPADEGTDGDSISIGNQFSHHLA